MERDDDYHNADDVWGDKTREQSMVIDQFAEEVKDLLVKAIMAMYEIEQSNGSPYIIAFQHCLLHVAKGGTIDTFKPLLRTPDYAGLDRRKTQAEYAVCH